MNAGLTLRKEQKEEEPVSWLLAVPELGLAIGRQSTVATPASISCVDRQE